MQEVLEFILKNITTVPDDVVITTEEDEGGTNYIISVNPTDVGRIIGREGKVIKAIRTIMRVIAIQKGVRVRVSVKSDDETSTPKEVDGVQIVSDNSDKVENVEDLVKDDELKVEI